jgi:putative Holliday junction resolvase
VREFANALEAAVGPQIQIIFWDERLSTTVAERTLQESGTWRRRRKGDIDAVAAAVILQGYLDACRAREMRRDEQNNADAR